MRVNNPRILFICIWLYLAGISNYKYVYKVMMLYIILTDFLSAIKKCCLFGHVTDACWYVAWTLSTADKGCLYLFVTSSKDSILLNSWLICLI